MTETTRVRGWLFPAMVGIAFSASIAWPIGCSGNGGGGAASTAEDEAAITKVAARAFTERAASKCSDALTTRFVRRVYGGLITCRRAQSEENSISGAVVAGIELRDGRARATVTLQGGLANGATGVVEFEDTDAGWKLDGLSVAFVRSYNNKAFIGTAASHPSLLGSRAARSCARASLARLSDDEARTLTYDPCAERPASAGAQTIVRVVDACSVGDHSVSPVRRYFEAELLKSLRAGGMPAARSACIKRKLRSSISDHLIAEAGRNAEAEATVARAAKKRQKIVSESRCRGICVGGPNAPAAGRSCKQRSLVGAESVALREPGWRDDSMGPCRAVLL